MSHDHSKDHAHSHGEHGPDGHHISSQKTLITVLLVLLALTVLTVYAAKEIPVSQTAHIVIALIIATTKAALVCLYFMHLLYDRIFYSAVLISCLFVFALFIIFTVLDIGGRAQLDPVRSQLVRSVPTDMVAKARYDEIELAGRELFMANCSVCHAADGSGVQNLGRMLQGNEFIRTRSIDELVLFLQVGRPANHPMNQTGVTMPARAGNPNLTDDQLRQIASWIKVMPNRQVKLGAGKGHGDEGH